MALISGRFSSSASVRRARGAGSSSRDAASRPLRVRDQPARLAHRDARDLEGPHIPVIGYLDVTSEELAVGRESRRCGSQQWLAFAVYALPARPSTGCSSGGSAPARSVPRGRAWPRASSRRWSATRPASSRRSGRGVARGRDPPGHARLLSPVVPARSSARQPRGTMEARGFGRTGERGRRARPGQGRPARASPAAFLLPAGGAVAVAQVGTPDVLLPRLRTALKDVSLRSSRARSSRFSARPARASPRSSARSPASCRISTGAASRGGSRWPAATRAASGRPTSPTRSRSSSRVPRTRSSSAASRTRSRSGSRTSATPAAQSSRARVALGARRRGASAWPSGAGDAVRRRAAARLPRVGARARAVAPPARRADLAARSRRRRSDPRPRVRERRRRRHLGAAARASTRALRSRALRRGGTADDRRVPRRGARAARAGVPAPRARPAPGSNFRRRDARPLDDVTYAYDAAPVLTGASLELRRGEVVALTGPNGAGKTTLAKIAAGLIEPDTGPGRAPGPRLLPVAGSGPLPRRRARRGRGRRSPSAATWGRVRKRWTRSAWPASASAIRAISPAASGSVWRSRPCSWQSPTCSSSTSPPAGSTLRARQSSQSFFAAPPPDRATLVVTHDLVFAGDVADSTVELAALEAAHA